jgi:hypothetical protein
MKTDQTTETTTSTPIGLINPDANLAAESDSRLPSALLRSEQMNFTIVGEEWVFTLLVDAEGNLTDFTADKGGVSCECFIQLVAQNNGDRTCCSPSGCTAGGC